MEVGKGEGRAEATITSLGTPKQGAVASQDVSLVRVFGKGLEVKPSKPPSLPRANTQRL